MIIISGRIRVFADRIPEATEVAATMARLSRAEDGCAAYDFGLDIEDDTVVRIFEQWESPESLEAHFATSHFADFSSAIVGVLDGEASFTRYEVSDAGPLFG
jgi:quinol monooxygenase YgiN